MYADIGADITDRNATSSEPKCI